MYAILKAARERLGFSPDLVEDICMGNVRITPLSDKVSDLELILYL